MHQFSNQDFLGVLSNKIMCGIFAYLNHLTPKTRKEILDLLIKGLQRLEYRGYDSAGVGIDGFNGNATIEVDLLLRQQRIILISSFSAYQGHW